MATSRTTKDRYQRLKNAGMCVKCGKREAAAGRVLCEHCASVSNAAKAAYKERLKKQAVKEENREPRYSISDVLQMYPDLTYGKAVAVLEGHGRFS